MAEDSFVARSAPVWGELGREELLPLWSSLGWVGQPLAEEQEG